MLKIILEVNAEKLKQMDQRTRKLMTMHMALHPRSDIDYMSQEKMEEEDLFPLKIGLIHRYDDLKTT